MVTEYTFRITIACPESLMAQANQLALIVGESASDDQTFVSADWQDFGGNKFAVVSFVAKPVFLGIPQAGLPVNPEHAPEADRVAAQEALDTLVAWVSPEEETTPPIITGLLMAVDDNPQKILGEWGLSRVEVI